LPTKKFDPILGLPEDEAGTHGEHEVEDPVEVLTPLPPVIEDDADVGHDVDEDHSHHQNKANGQDEDLVGPKIPASTRPRRMESAN
jgi:hypothetical protein